MANEQLNPTPDEEREPVAAETPAAEETLSRTNHVAEVDAGDDLSADTGESETDESEDEDEEVVERSVEGPAQYAPREKGGRMQRVGRDVRADDVNYKNIGLLSRFLDGRGRILSRRKTRVSAKIQRKVVKAIKHARHLALLPYTGDHSRIVRKRR